MTEANPPFTMTLALDSNNYNPRNINKESPQIPNLESGQVHKDKYSFLCGSKVIWDSYSTQEQSCLAYSYGERLKVCRNTDKQLFIAQDFVNFQQYFLGLDCSLVKKDRRLPLSSIPAPRERKFSHEWREVTDTFPQLPCLATLPSYSSGYPTDLGCTDCILEFSDNSCLLIRNSRAIGVKCQDIVISLSHLSREDIDNCITYLVYGEPTYKTVVSNADWIGHVCADIQNRCFGLTERETVQYEQYVLDCTIYYNLRVNNTGIRYDFSTEPVPIMYLYCLTVSTSVRNSTFFRSILTHLPVMSLNPSIPEITTVTWFSDKGPHFAQNLLHL